MIITAKLKYLRIAPRKVRLVADLIRNKMVFQAKTILNFQTKKAAKPLLKLLNSAIVNAKNNFQLEEAQLYISKITIDEGPKLKRWRARARGQAAEIQKKTSHINLVLDEIKGKIAAGGQRIKKEEVEEKMRIKKEMIKSPAEGPKLKRKPKVIFKGEHPTIEKIPKRIFRRKAF